LTASSYIVHDYTTSGTVEYICAVVYMYCIYSIYTFLYNVVITNAIKTYETHIHSAWYRTVVVLLHEESLFQIVGI